MNIFEKTILANLPKCRNYPPGRVISAPSAYNFGTTCRSYPIVTLIAVFDWSKSKFRPNL